MTPSEIQQAMALGLSLVKLFPAGSLGIDYLRSLQGPFGEVSFVPTGGVSLDSAPAWLDAGAVAVGIGGALVSADQTKREQMKSQIRALSERT
jgi:2-dehydro-3-deoxyphosphogluconate aldolase/(4S)-4-hydroxy-2-oxoglutarate aldolase